MARSVNDPSGSREQGGLIHMSKKLTRRNFLEVAGAAGAALALAACGGGEEAPADGGEEGGEAAGGDTGKLVVYTPHSEEEISIEIPPFEEQTGISVEVVSAGAGELISRISAEVDNPQGDILFGGSMGTSLASLDLWEEYVPEEDANVMEPYRSKENKVSTYTLVPTVILVNPELIGDIEIKGFNDLLNPELKGKIAFADPAASSLSNVLVFNMLLARGDGENYDAGWEWMEKFCAQLDGKILDGSSKVPKGVADGEYAVGLSHELYFASYRDSGIEAVWPEEGSAVITGPIQIIKGGPNPENAKKFMEYALGQDFQQRYMEQHNARTVRTDVDAPEGVPPFDSLKTFEEPIVTSDEQNAVLEKFTDLVYA